MKHWGSAFFPLSLLAVLTLLTFWLRYATELSEPNRDGKFRHDPDYIVGDAVLRKLDPNGRLQYTLRAKDVRHYPDDDTTDLQQPDLLYLDPKKPPMTVRADIGQVRDNKERIDLSGNVRIVRAAAGKDAEMVATTDQLAVFPDDETAFTRSPVLITQGNSWVKGVGMRVNNRDRTYLIESQAVGLMESKKTRK